MQASNAGPERYVLAVALLVPLVVAAVAMAQLPGTGLASPSSLLLGNDAVSLVARRPAASRPAPPPTLAPPTATPRPTATLVATATLVPTATAVPATPTPERARTYVVQKGDELKHIAAQYHVSIWTLIAQNEIPNPDSLRIGQVLRIPDDQ